MDVLEATTSKTAEPIFAFGNHDTYLFATPELWQRNNFPAEIEDEIGLFGSVKSIERAAFGAKKSSYFVSYSDGLQTFHCYNNLPPLLTQWIKSRRTPSPNVVLGPKDSFIAWDETSCVSGGVAFHLADAVRSVNPYADWMPGRPRIVTLGVAGSYILITEEAAFVGKFAGAYPSLYNLLLTLDCGLNARNADERWVNIWKRIRHLTLHPYQADAFILVDDTNKLHCHKPPTRHGTDMHFDIRAVARTLLDPSNAMLYRQKAEASKLALRSLSPEQLRLIAQRTRKAAQARKRDAQVRMTAAECIHVYEKMRAAAEAEEKKEKERKETRDKGSKRKREHEEEEVPRKRPNNAARSMVHAPELLHAWLDTVKLGLDTVEAMTVFPFAPVVGVPCKAAQCCTTKKEQGEASPGVCVHELETLLKAHGDYSHAWLKAKRIQWHPDAKWVRAPVEVREVFGERARVMFTMFGTLMDKLQKS